MTEPLVPTDAESKQRRAREAHPVRRFVPEAP
jgi:hypothetical protein